MNRKQFHSLLATALMLCGAVLGLASCAEADNPVIPSNPLGNAIYGPWFATLEWSGTMHGIDYEYVGQAAEFNNDGTGV